MPGRSKVPRSAADGTAGQWNHGFSKKAEQQTIAGNPTHALAQGDIHSVHSTLRAPYQRIAVHISALPNSITFTQQADGRRDASISFDGYVYSEDGALLLTNGRELKLHLTPRDYKRIMDSVLSLDFLVSVPASHAAFLRMGVEDIPTGRVGAIEIPSRPCWTRRRSQLVSIAQPQH